MARKNLREERWSPLGAAAGTPRRGRSATLSSGRRLDTCASVVERAARWPPRASTIAPVAHLRVARSVAPAPRGPAACRRRGATISPPPSGRGARTPARSAAGQSGSPPPAAMARAPTRWAQAGLVGESSACCSRCRRARGEKPPGLDKACAHAALPCLRGSRRSCLRRLAHVPARRRSRGGPRTVRPRSWGVPGGGVGAGAELDGPARAGTPLTRPARGARRGHGRGHGPGAAASARPLACGPRSRCSGGQARRRAPRRVARLPRQPAQPRAPGRAGAPRGARRGPRRAGAPRRRAGRDGRGRGLRGRRGHHQAAAARQQGHAPQEGQEGQGQEGRRRRATWSARRRPRSPRQSQAVGPTPGALDAEVLSRPSTPPARSA